MISSDWLALEALLLGIWPRRDLEPAAMYVRLLSAVEMTDIEQTIDRLAATSKFAPTPSELLQAVNAHSSANGLDREQAYGQSIGDWLGAKLPDVCKPDAKVVVLTRRVYGDLEAEQLAASTAPHPAAVAAVIRLHHAHGKGRLTVREHGPAIRAAVKANNKHAIADLEAIAAKRDRDTSTTAGRTVPVTTPVGGA